MRSRHFLCTPLASRFGLAPKKTHQMSMLHMLYILYTYDTPPSFLGYSPTTYLRNSERTAFQPTKPVIRVCPDTLIRPRVIFGGGPPRSPVILPCVGVCAGVRACASVLSGRHLSLGGFRSEFLGVRVGLGDIRSLKEPRR